MLCYVINSFLNAWYYEALIWYAQNSNEFGNFQVQCRWLIFNIFTLQKQRQADEAAKRAEVEALQQQIADMKALNNTMQAGGGKKAAAARVSVWCVIGYFIPVFCARGSWDFMFSGENNYGKKTTGVSV